ncbi:outer membrane protein assembly factor BamB [Novimethylophilus kurashikiensis]|uniref:Outer membrane protein assembly factor BamB n=1 Tax=Novimethylophilus kurashikiensis TaxID=1825523 RepID=A0A2R5F994_9PROT|nr:copper-binding protein [Novimethylophilus kurashikiensis]GBG14767.1 outer membrane protein assembly factor BamB [Novimethylophilus kurashikiensis]
MNKTIFAAAFAALFNLVAIPVYADTHESHHAAGAETQKTYAAKGEVVSLDQENGKAKIRHEAIPELGWQGMTMVFPVADKNLLKDVNPGDKIDFTIAKNPSGQYTIQTLQPAK